MESFSSGRLLMLFLLVPLFAALANGKKDSNDICKEKDKPGFKLNLAGAMIFPKYILMIDSNLLVYEVPKSNYNGSYGKMVLNITGKPIEQYWPKFATNSDWKCIRPLYKTIFHLINEQTKDVFINFLVNHNNKCKHGEDLYSVCYNLNTQEFCPLPALNTGFLEQFYIDTGLKIYSFELFKVESTSIFFPVLFTWKFRYNAENHTVKSGASTRPFMIYYLVNKDNPSNDRNVSFYKGSNFTAKPEDPPAGYRLENITDWHIAEDFLPVGYLFEGSFYLYALDKLITFEDRLPSYDDQVNHQTPDGKLIVSTKMTTIKMSDFIQCDSEDSSNVTYPPTLPSNHSKSAFSTVSSTLLIVIIASVVVLLLILIVAGITIYCFCFGTNKKKPKKDSKHQKLSKNSTVARSSVGGRKVSTSKVGSRVGSKVTAAREQSKVVSSTAVSAASNPKIGKKNK